MSDSLSVKVNYTLLPNPSPQVFYARLRQPIPVTRTQEDSTFAHVSLKPCLSAICKSRPDLVLDLANLDYSIASLDYQETQYVRDNKLADQAKGLFVSPIKANGHDKVWEGKGLLSWALQAADDGEAEMIVGKVDSRSSSLEVCLQLTERKTVSRPSFLDSLYSSSASSAFPASASPSSVAGLSPSCFEDPTAGTTTSSSADQQPDFMLNVIQPTPARSDLGNTQCIPATSSSPAAIAANHPKRALSAPLNSPLLSIAEGSVEAASSTTAQPTAQQQQQILGLIQQLLPQFQANSADNQAVLPLIQTLVQYLAAPPPTSPSGSTSTDKENTPLSGVTMDSLVSLLQTARQASDVLPPASVPAPQPNTLKASTKRKRDTSAPPAVSSSSAHVPALSPAAGPSSSKADDQIAPAPTGPKIKRSKARLKVDAAEGEDSAAKLKYDPVGCSNCRTHFATLWRKSKNDPTDRLCNACGVYFNRQGKHRPAELGVGTKKTQPRSDGFQRASSASITPTLPAVESFTSTSIAFPPIPISAAMKTSMTSPPRRPDFLDEIRKSPRRHSIAASSPVRHYPSTFVTTESPGTALNRIMSDAMGPEEAEPKKKRIKARPSSKLKQEPTSDLPFMDDNFFNKAFAHPPAPATSASLASSVFSEWQPQSDIFSTMTSEVDPLPARKKGSRHRASSSGALDTPFDFGSLFSDQSWTENSRSDAAPTHQQLFEEAVKGRHVFSNVPPSSPPFKHLLPQSGSDSGESPLNPPPDELVKEIADLSMPSNVTWSEEAVSFLQNALMQDPNAQMDLSGLGMDLGDPATLQDLLASLTNGLSPGSVGTPPTAGLDVGLVAKVDAETAMEIWEREVQARFGDVSS